MQEREANIEVDLENNEMTGRPDMRLEDVRLRRNMHVKEVTITWEVLRDVCSCRFWLILNAYTFVFNFMFYNVLIQDWMWERFRIGRNRTSDLMTLLIFSHCYMSVWVFERYRGRPYRMVGRFRRGVIDLTTLCAAIAVRNYIPNYRPTVKNFMVPIPLTLIIWLTIYFHSWGQNLHRLSDMGKTDMLLGVLMQVIVRISTKRECVFAVIFFLFIIFCRICRYKVSITPEALKKDLESLPY